MCFSSAVVTSTLPAKDNNPAHYYQDTTTQHIYCSFILSDWCRGFWHNNLPHQATSTKILTEKRVLTSTITLFCINFTLKVLFLVVLNLSIWTLFLFLHLVQTLYTPFFKVDFLQQKCVRRFSCTRHWATNGGKNWRKRVAACFLFLEIHFALCWVSYFFIWKLILQNIRSLLFLSIILSYFSWDK